MNNLFRMFDPSTREMFRLNWFTLLAFLAIFPKVAHSKRGRYDMGYRSLVNFLHSDFSMAIGVSPMPGLTPWLVSAFMLTVTINFLGLIPYNFTASRNLRVTLSISLFLWVGIQVGYLVKAKNHFLAHLVPLGTPGVLIPFMVFIELIRAVIRPLTLAVRLAANMVAGHLLICLVNGAPYYSPVIPVVLLAGIMLMILELGVVFIQAYVFRTLRSLYYAELNERLEL